MDCFASLAMTWMVLHHSQLSSPAHAGDPVRRGFSAQSLASLGYWVPACAGTTSEGVTRSFAISRHDLPEVLQIVSPSSIQRAQGMPDARCTRGLMCDVHSRTCT